MGNSWYNVVSRKDVQEIVRTGVTSIEDAVAT